MSIDERLEYGPEALEGHEDFLDQSFEEEMMGFQGHNGQDFNQID